MGKWMMLVATSTELNTTLVGVFTVTLRTRTRIDHHIVTVCFYNRTTRFTERRKAGTAGYSCEIQRKAYPTIPILGTFYLTVIVTMKDGRCAAKAIARSGLTALRVRTIFMLLCQCLRSYCCKKKYRHYEE